MYRFTSDASLPLRSSESIMTFNSSNVCSALPPKGSSPKAAGASHGERSRFQLSTFTAISPKSSVSARSLIYSTSFPRKDSSCSPTIWINILSESIFPNMIISIPTHLYQPIYTPLTASMIALISSISCWIFSTSIFLDNFVKTLFVSKES